jgi:hypothetical protein
VGVQSGSSASGGAEVDVTGRLDFASGSDRADATAFLARVLRLDQGALVRLRGGGGAVGLWAWLPLEVLVTRAVHGSGPVDVTVEAKALFELLARDGGIALPPGRDVDWPGALPAPGVRELDEIPAEVVTTLLAAGERTFREASAGADPRAVGDALLDHEVLTVSAGELTAAIPLRLLLALARMGFLGDEPLRIGLAGGWIRAAASYGVAYRRRGRLALFPASR